MGGNARFVLILLAVCWRVPSAAAGEVQGRIVILRALTKQRVTVPDYQTRGVAVAKPPSEKPSIDAEFQRIAVYLEGNVTLPIEPVTATLKQSQRRFEPELVLIPAGSAVSFPNQDPIFHNVFSLSPTKSFDLGYYPAGDTRIVRFDRPGIVQVYCHLHPDMSAAIVVSPTRWYQQPSPDGTFRFSGIPAGTYRVVVWHKSVGFFREEVEINDESVKQLSFTIPLAAESN